MLQTVYRRFTWRLIGHIFANFFVCGSKSTANFKLNCRLFIYFRCIIVQCWQLLKLAFQNSLLVVVIMTRSQCVTQKSLRDWKKKFILLFMICMSPIEITIKYFQRNQHKSKDLYIVPWNIRNLSMKWYLCFNLPIHLCL